jgi:polyhydroxybutyrate depolymerase
MRTALVLVAVTACGSDPKPPPPTTFGGDRPAQLSVPDGFDPTNNYPLVVVLHGYGASGFVQTAYFGANALPQEGKAFLIAPDGLTDSMGHQFWNADAACCDFDHQNPDDVGYISGLVEDISAAYPIDPFAVWLVGHSNGGYMAYRMACERPDIITNIVVLAGDEVSDPGSCRLTPPVAVLHLHGSVDTTVPYAGAMPSVTTAAGFAHCATTSAPGPAMDIDASLTGSETTTITFDECPPGVAVELWTIEGAGHIPNLVSGFADLIFDYLKGHRRLLPD